MGRSRQKRMAFRRAATPRLFSLSSKMTIALPLYMLVWRRAGISFSTMLGPLPRPTMVLRASQLYLMQPSLTNQTKHPWSARSWTGRYGLNTGRANSRWARQIPPGASRLLRITVAEREPRAQYFPGSLSRNLGAVSVVFSQLIMPYRSPTTSCGGDTSAQPVWRHTRSAAAFRPIGRTPQRLRGRLEPPVIPDYRKCCYSARTGPMSPGLVEDLPGNSSSGVTNFGRGKWMANTH